MAATMRDARPAAKSGETPPAPLVRAELDRMLTSELFARSERLSSFLRFIVERTLAGDGDSLKEYTIGVEVYGRDTSFDTAEDPIVRIDARRLRDKLREYYAGVGDAPVVISVPKGRYTPTFSTRVVTDAPSASAPLPPEKRPVPRWLLALAALAVIAAATWVAWSRTGNAPPPRTIIVTSLPGSEDDPSLSPDGRSVTFSWAGPSADANHDIWIKSVEGEQKRNLTNTPDADEHWARWSPDGQWITFSRRTKEGWAIIKVSPLSGDEETIATNASDSSWTPESDGLVMISVTSGGRGHVVQHDLKTGRRRFIIDTPADFKDFKPRVSPNGETLAFLRAASGRTAIFLMPMAGGTPTILGEWVGGPIGGLDWMPDGRELVASVPIEGIRRLIRIPVNGRGPRVPVPATPLEVAGVSVSRVDATPRLRLAVSGGQPNVGLRLVDLAAPSPVGAIVADSPFCNATRLDGPGRFSPDGQQVAFVSNRDGGFQVWVANRDGSALHPVTHLQDARVINLSWSPDARRLAFDATIHDHTDIYVVEVSSRAATQLSDGMNAREPDWSRDGQRIYFSSNRSGSPAIWMMRADGGGVTQLTSEPGFELRESNDGRSVYFVSQTDGIARLKHVWVESRLVEPVDLQLTPYNWDVTDSGIMFLANQSEGIQNSNGGRNVLQLYDFADHSIRKIGRLGFVVGPFFGAPRFLAVSRDGRWALASHLDHYERDITVLDGFR